MLKYLRCFFFLYDKFISDGKETWHKIPRNVLIMVYILIIWLFKKSYENHQNYTWFNHVPEILQGPYLIAVMSGEIGQMGEGVAEAQNGIKGFFLYVLIGQVFF